MSDPWKVFEKDVGTWTAEIEVRPQPGGEPVRSKGVSTSRLACGGRWLVTDYQADSGFEGHGVYGWDAAKSAYVGTWVDNMRTFLAISTGAWDAEKKIMTFTTEAVVGERTIRWREVTETVDADHQIYRSFMPGPDGEFEMMTVRYARR
jgi:hypothetical protein